jgi:predicted aspartyl protease
MMRAVIFLVAFIALTSVSPAQDRPIPAAGDPGQSAETIEPVDILELVSRRQRMTVPVSIDGADSYPFVIDTGAERTVISRELAERLALESGPQVRLVTMTGATVVPTVHVPRVSLVRTRNPRTVVAPSLAALHLGAPGLLGIDMLADHRVLIDLDRNTMTVRPSRRTHVRSLGTNDIIVRAASPYRQLIVTDAEYRSQRVRVVIATGSAITVGNMAFRRLIGSRGKPVGTIPITSVVGGQISADYHQVDRFRLGGMTLTHLPVAFADVAPFAALDLDEVPAMLLGMDAFRVFRSVEMDFRTRDIRFEIRGPPGPQLRRS